MTEAEFTEALVKRLALRKGTADGDVFTLNLRRKAFGNQVPRYVRCPDDAGWPEKGRTTSDAPTAEDWVRRGYAARLFREIQRANATAGSSTTTFEAAADSYVHARMKHLGTSALRKMNSRISMLRNHVIPAIGHLQLNKITRPMIREHAENLIVRKRGQNGSGAKGEAELGTKRNFVRAVMAVWMHAFPDDACPWAGIRLYYKQATHSREQALADGDFEALLESGSGALRPADFHAVLLGALHYDLQQGAKANVRVSMIPNTAYAIVIQTALGLRISELRSLRWKHIDFEKRVVYIMGTKTQNALRVVPLQEQLVPWLLEWKQRQGPNFNPKAFVIRTNARASVLTPAALTTLSTRYAWALKLAGLKKPKKATHWARATHASWADPSPLISLEHLKVYFGHAAPRGGSTDDYVEQLVELMPDDHRRYIQHIPTPAAARAALKNFAPTALVPWRARRKLYSRSKSARAAQHARAVARVPKHGKLR